MQYRTFGKLDWKPSALGFGAMRLPVIDNDPSRIDEAETTRMVRHAIDCGVNYVDTAYNYHRQTSEKVLGRVLQDGYRERVRLATKMPCWLVEKPDDFDRLLDEQLANLQTGYVDFYLLHSLDGQRWPKVRDLGVCAWAERALADGRIGHLGFSFHDDLPAFQEIIDGCDLWTLCQIQYNYLDTEYQAGTKGLRYAAGKGLAVVIMEPLRGGSLARNIPPAVQAIWSAGAVPPPWNAEAMPPPLGAGATGQGTGMAGALQRTPADWALQWVWNQPEVSLVLSGMSTMEQVEENLASADRSGVGTMTEEELALVDRAREAYRALCAIPCTACKYSSASRRTERRCLPCPSGVDIPEVFYIYNDLLMYGDEARSKQFYAWLDEKARADQCIECGERSECLRAKRVPLPFWWRNVLRPVLCRPGTGGSASRSG